MLYAKKSYPGRRVGEEWGRLVKKSIKKQQRRNEFFVKRTSDELARFTNQDLKFLQSGLITLMKIKELRSGIPISVQMPMNTIQSRITRADNGMDNEMADWFGRMK